MPEEVTAGLTEGGARQLATTTKSVPQYARCPAPPDAVSTRSAGILPAPHSQLAQPGSLPYKRPCDALTTAMQVSFRPSPREAFTGFVMNPRLCCLCRLRGACRRLDQGVA